MPQDRPITVPDFARFVRKERRRLQGALMKLCDGSSNVDDALQEAFMSAYEKWDKIGAMERPDAWIVKVAIRRLHRDRRQDANRNQILRNSSRCLATEAEGHPIEHLAACDEVHQMIRKLPEKQRECIVLHYILELSVKETADCLHLPEGTVKTRLSRARERLQQLLRESKLGGAS